MTPATLEKLPVATTAGSAPTAAAPASTVARVVAAKTKTLLVGCDLGTNKSCILAGPATGTDIAVSKVVPTVVGYVKDGIVDGIITGNARIVFGEDALRNMLHVRLVAPVAEGVITDPAAARDFLNHLRSLIDPAGTAEIRAVIGMPANAGTQARDDIRRCAFGIFDRVLMIPEPFLAALGYRDDARIAQTNYLDPVVNSLFIDIGGGTSDLCLVQGVFPSSEDQISIPFAGDAIDELLHAELERVYPNNGLSRHKVREIKEAHAYVGPSRKPLDVRVIMGGKAHTIEMGDTIARVNVPGAVGHENKMVAGKEVLGVRAVVEPLAGQVRSEEHLRQHGFGDARRPGVVVAGVFVPTRPPADEPEEDPARARGARVHRDARRCAVRAGHAIDHHRGPLARRNPERHGDRRHVGIGPDRGVGGAGVEAGRTELRVQRRPRVGRRLDSGIGPRHGAGVEASGSGRACASPGA